MFESWLDVLRDVNHLDEQLLLGQKAEFSQNILL